MAPRASPTREASQLAAVTTSTTTVDYTGGAPQLTVTTPDGLNRRYQLTTDFFGADRFTYTASNVSETSGPGTVYATPSVLGCA